MKIKYFTIGDGPYFKFMAEDLAKRLKHFNGIDLCILTDELARIKDCGNCQYWLKAYLWDFAGDAERVVYIDSDVLLIRPIVLPNESVFMARKDVATTVRSQKYDYYPELFGNIDTYFNNGFFVADRVIENVFDQLKEDRYDPKRASCWEQTWMNMRVDEWLKNTGYEMTILDDMFIHMPKGEPCIRPEDVTMIHYAGFNKPDKLAAYSRDMINYLIGGDNV